MSVNIIITCAQHYVWPHITSKNKNIRNNSQAITELNVTEFGIQYCEIIVKQCNTTLYTSMPDFSWGWNLISWYGWKQCSICRGGFGDFGGSRESFYQRVIVHERRLHFTTSDDLALKKNVYKSPNAAWLKGTFFERTLSLLIVATRSIPDLPSLARTQ